MEENKKGLGFYEAMIFGEIKKLKRKRKEKTENLIEELKPNLGRLWRFVL